MHSDFSPISIQALFTFLIQMRKSMFILCKKKKPKKTKLYNKKSGDLGADALNQNSLTVVFGCVHKFSQTWKGVRNSLYGFDIKYVASKANTSQSQEDECRLLSMCRTKWLIGTTTMYKLDVHLLQILNTWGKATISLWSLNYSSWIKTLHCVEICCRFQDSTNINLLSCTFSVGFPDRLCSAIQKPFFYSGNIKTLFQNHLKTQQRNMLIATSLKSQDFVS